MMKKIFLFYLFFSLLLFSTFGLNYVITPSQVRDLSEIITLKIYNSDEEVKHLIIVSYLLNNNKIEYKTSTPFKIQPAGYGELRRNLPNIHYKNASFVFEIYGDDKRKFSVPILYESETQVGTKQITIIREDEKMKESKGSSPTKKQDKSYLCAGILVLMNPTKGVGLVFDQNDDIYLSTTIEDPIKGIKTDWDVEYVDSGVYKLSFPKKLKPYFNRVVVEFENCGNRTLEFYVNQPKNTYLVVLTISLVLILIFVAFYADLAMKDYHRTKKKIHKHLEKKNKKIMHERKVSKKVRK